MLPTAGVNSFLFTDLEKYFQDKVDILQISDVTIIIIVIIFMNSNDN